MTEKDSAKNTDKEIWRKVPDDYYSPSIHVTEKGDIGINVGGYVIVASVEDWHRAAKETFYGEKKGGLPMSQENIEKIEAEDWKKAPGIKHRKDDTNSALAPRDYSVPCKAENLIVSVKGYNLWWCSSHHQPLAWCEMDQLRHRLTGLNVKLEELKEIVFGMEEL